MTLKVHDLAFVRKQEFLFQNICFSLQAGDLLLVQGANGAGKTTLLKMIALLSLHEQGKILWKDQDAQTLKEEYWQALHYISHGNGLKQTLTVYENLLLTQALHFKKIDAEEVLMQLQLMPLKNLPAYQLSAGQKRRLALARLFLIKKPLWILDEPLASLDATLQTFFLKNLQLHLSNGGICLLSSHQPIPFATQTLSLGTHD